MDDKETSWKERSKIMNEKNNFNWHNIKPVVVLTVICAAVAILLALANLITEPIITESEGGAITESLQQVISGGLFNSTPDEMKDGAPETVKAVYTEKNGKGTVVVLSTNKGYTGKEIGITVGIDKDGKIINMVITKNEESIVPEILKPGGSYGDAYVGKGGNDIPELSTGATVKYTESAIKNALIDAISYLGFEIENEPEELYKPDGELLKIAEELIGKEVKELTLNNADKTLKKLYRAKDGAGYVAYLRTYAAYGGAPETETFVAFDGDGKITKVENLYWKVGHTEEQGAPNSDEVENFFDGYENKTESQIDGVELVSGATGTANNFKAALSAACKSINAVKADDAPKATADNVQYIIIAAVSFVLLVTVMLLSYKLKKGGRK